MQNDVNKIYDDVQSGKSIDQLTTIELKYILETIEGLDAGKLRVCTKTNQEWITQEWIKKAILLYFRIQKMDIMTAGDFTYFDKIPVKKWTEEDGVRVVPHALARKGSFIEKGAILMPSYVNIGAYVGSGTMVDTWATVGSCAQIGKNVHLSGGVGIGGVLEPVQASPVIIEDNAFIGSRCIVVEGAIVEEGSVLGAGVTITASTKIIDVSGSTTTEYKGRIPSNSVVIPGTQMKEFQAGTFGVPCALIIGKRKASTDLKTSLTNALRDYQVSV
ncbi:MAG: 2,3,4,5-tetrahydropyridine-2,6-dicarboxylate N-succinyltransferase [Bdellovibrio sp.]